MPDQGGGERPGGVSRALGAFNGVLGWARSRWRLFTTLALAAAAVLALVEARISLSELENSLARFDALSLALAFALAMGQAAGQAGRLRVLFPRHSGLKTLTVARAYFAGQMLNTFLPGRAGDIAKVIALAGRSGQHGAISNVTGVVIADKLLDVLAIVTLLAFLASRLPIPVPIGTVAWVFGAAVALLLGGSALLARVRGPRLRAIGARFLEGLLVLKRPGHLIPGISISLASWCVEILAVQVLANAVGTPISFGASALAVTVLNVGILLPVSALNVGTFEVAMVVGLAQVGIPTAPAAAVTLVHHLLEILAVIAWYLALLPFRGAPRQREPEGSRA